MTDEQIRRQIEVIESVGREVSKSPESARKFLEELGVFFEDKKKRKIKRKNNE